ncbi:MFS transporter, partial [Bacillus sp. S34]|nr:MFS transporter [Bacillus sp. S34]
IRVLIFLPYVISEVIVGTGWSLMLQSSGAVNALLRAHTDRFHDTLQPLLIAGSSGMFVSLLMVAIAFSQATIVNGEPNLPGAWGVIALIFANLFVVSFGATWGPLMWVLLGEM